MICYSKNRSSLRIIKVYLMSNSLINNNKIDFRAADKKDSLGFTLVEMAIVIMIGGILMAFMGSALMAYLKKSRVMTTEFRMEKIQEAMDQYLDINRRYPCVASRILGPDDGAFGRMDTSCGSAGAGTAVSGGTVHIGAVPTRTLNLPDEFMADAWGQKFTMAVTIGLTNIGTYIADGGRIEIVDKNSTIYDKAHYVLVSHGVTGFGGYMIGAAANPIIPCASAGDPEKENCEAAPDNVFLTTLTTSDAGMADFYDDYLVYQGQTEPVVAPIPAGAIVPFVLALCPVGWSDYVEAEGRFIMGMKLGAAPLTIEHQPIMVEFTVGALGTVSGSVSGSGTVTDIPNLIVDFPLEHDTDSADIVDIDVSLGNTTNEVDEETMIPPYVALRYCRKG